MGWIEVDDEHYIFVGDYYNVLLIGQGLTEHALNRIKIKFMTPEERKKAELIEQKRLESLEEMHKKQEYMKKMQEQSEQDRKERACQKAKPSVANQMNFGANIVKFQPPANQGR